MKVTYEYTNSDFKIVPDRIMLSTRDPFLQSYHQNGYKLYVRAKLLPKFLRHFDWTYEDASVDYQELVDKITHRTGVPWEPVLKVLKD